MKKKKKKIAPKIEISRPYVSRAYKSPEGIYLQLQDSHFNWESRTPQSIIRQNTTYDCGRQV